MLHSMVDFGMLGSRAGMAGVIRSDTNGIEVDSYFVYKMNHEPDQCSTRE